LTVNSTLSMTSSIDVVSVAYDSPDPALIEKAASLLRGGSLVVAATDTMYGLLARADDPVAVMRVCDTKQRSRDLPMAIFVGSVEVMPRFARVTPAATVLASRFLPGPVTLVLAAALTREPPIVVNGRIGLRVSSAPVIRMLLDRANFPLTATSANLSGRGGGETVRDVSEALGSRVSLLLDSGRLTSAPSTVVDCSIVPVRVLRAGVVSQDEIASTLKDIRCE